VSGEAPFLSSIGCDFRGQAPKAEKVIPHPALTTATPAHTTSQQHKQRLLQSLNKQEWH